MDLFAISGVCFLIGSVIQLIAARHMYDYNIQSLTRSSRVMLDNLEIQRKELRLWEEAANLLMTEGVDLRAAVQRAESQRAA